MNAVAMPNPIMQTGEIPPHILEILKRPLPEEAIGKHPRIKGLSSIKAAFVIERLIEAFGPGGWHETVEIIDKGKRQEVWSKGKPEERTVDLYVATVKLTFTIDRYGIYKENFGGSDNEDFADALKGARTDALTKIASEFGIGLDVYKGRGGEAAEVKPTCPDCHKVGAIIKGKQDFGGGYLCWDKKGGCGSKFTDDEYALIVAGKSLGGGNVIEKKAPQSAQVDRKAPAADGPEKVTIQDIANEVSIDGDTLWMKVGERTCATKTPELIKNLQRTKGKAVELLVSKIESQKHGTIWQIHKLIGWKAVQA